MDSPVVFSIYAEKERMVSDLGTPYTIPPAMALFRRKFRLTACATTGG
jgi:hypothetical protein